MYCSALQKMDSLISNDKLKIRGKSIQFTFETVLHVAGQFLNTPLQLRVSVRLNQAQGTNKRCRRQAKPQRSSVAVSCVHRLRSLPSKPDPSKIMLHFHSDYALSGYKFAVNALPGAPALPASRAPLLAVSVKDLTRNQDHRTDHGHPHRRAATHIVLTSRTCVKCSTRSVSLHRYCSCSNKQTCCAYTNVHGKKKCGICSLYVSLVCSDCKKVSELVQYATHYWYRTSTYVQLCD